MPTNHKRNGRKGAALAASISPLPAGSLRLLCDTSAFNFQTTNDLPSLEDVIGQPRALRALEMGSAVTGAGFNIFALGLPDSGRTNLIRKYLERTAQSKAPPDDWCYINNFANAHQPTTLRLPAGLGKAFRADMQSLISSCEQAIPQAFQSEGYTEERDRLVNDMKKQQETEFSRLADLASSKHFAIGRGPMGVVLVPTVDGRPYTPEEVQKLPAEKIAEFTRLENDLEAEVNQSLEHLREAERTTHDMIHDLDARTALFVVEHLIEKVKAKYADLKKVVAYLDAVKADVVSSAKQFRKDGDAPDEQSSSKWLRRYDVNLLVDNSNNHGSPVVVESQPTYQNLLGRIEHEVIMGGMQTDFTMIRPGALHRANGGYLIIPARDLLVNPYAWEGLKRVLRDGSIRIVEMSNELGLLSTSTLEPEAIPLAAKIVLIGTPLLYYLLSEYDEDFQKLFKVKAEFATSMARTADTEREYALFVKSVVDANGLLPFDRSGVARIIEHGARVAEDQKRLTTRLGKIADLIREASYWAAKDQQTIVTSAMVERAIREEIYRDNLLEERMQDLTVQGTLLIDVAGKAAGQINGLSVLTLGDYAFGHPTRITASARPGQGGLIDIERKAELGGRIHTKGVLIINGFLGMRYGRNHPLSLSASLAFEQSYEGVEGDSASAAELIALLSSVADIPLRQDIAITGSMNQHGQIQAIGGVNEKIEGFFAVCSQKGLTGSQGVIIPASNVRHLFLRDEVVKAVETGQFSIWPVTTIDEAVTLLSGYQAGTMRADGTYPKGTFNHAVMARLDEFARLVEATSEESRAERAAGADT